MERYKLEVSRDLCEYWQITDLGIVTRKIGEPSWRNILTATITRKIKESITNLQEMLTTTPIMLEVSKSFTRGIDRKLLTPSKLDQADQSLGTRTSTRDETPLGDRCPIASKTCPEDESRRAR